MVNGCQFIDVLLLNGDIEHGGQEQDGMVSRWLRAVGSGRRGCCSGLHLKVVDVVDRCSAYNISLL